MQKPVDSSIEIRREGQQILIQIPSAGLAGRILGTVGFAVMWNAIVGIMTVATLGEGNIPGFFFQLIFVGVGLFLAIKALFQVFGTTELIADRHELVVNQRLFSYTRSRRRSVSHWDGVEEAVMYRVNKRPVWGIRLDFDEESNIKFGATLSDEERVWLIEELRALRQGLQGK